MQRSLFEENMDALLPLEKTVPGERPARKPFQAHLPHKEIVFEPLSTESCPDPECPGALYHIRDEVSEKMEYIPAHRG